MEKPIITNELHAQRLYTALAAVDAVFTDISVSRETARLSLEYIKSEIEISLYTEALSLL